MALVWRGGRPYFYDAKKRGGRVISRYIGSGPIALLARDAAEEARSERDLRRAREKAAWAALEALERELDDLVRRAKRAARAALEAAGYHQHQRGPWRKRRSVGDHAEVGGRPTSEPGRDGGTPAPPEGNGWGPDG